ncbi:AraC family transcriptional regulator [Mammaliicoccus sciuri]|uniref:AraC-type DNA-binding protein n=1 Tax=Sporosarcina newyorkensis TaxID=759851 RepID=A0A1T4YPR4_9BACL|nr:MULTISPECIES: AraC family transcriptional regulator [Sporosarcina]MBY0222197.1 helix-turn-helix transcriptional regulator [Sporosarcina aquimarina]SKB03255.1 AraC-type DNA-binding protein [Sporosarcina newyorkensis]
MTNKRIVASSLELINAAEKENSTQEAKTFFRLEEELLQQIFALERDKARDTLKEIQQILALYTPGFSIKVIQYHFIVLSAIVTRQLQVRAILNEENAFTFSGTCIELIEQNLTVDNAKEIGDELIEFFCYVLKEKEKPSLLHETVNEVIQYIDENVEKQLVVEEIAKRFSVSTSHLSRIFREYTSVTLVEFITIRKIEEVQYYLRFTDQKIAEIAERFHFCNQSYFTRVFKKYTGVTPRRFRKDLDGNYFQFTIKKDDSL